MMGGGEYTREPAHQETVASFEIGRTEVTTAQYRKCVNDGGCPSPSGIRGLVSEMTEACLSELANECNLFRSDREAHPINCVTVREAEIYCRWLGQRLPTNSEWEFAARGLESRPFPWGHAAWSPKRANLCDELCLKLLPCPFALASSNMRDGFLTTAPVGSYPEGATLSGLEDMSGNVWEWTASTSREPDKTTHAPLHIARGGAWSSNAAFDLSLDALAALAFPSIGFRCAKDVVPQPGQPPKQ
jgi:formylglycine-generating enzyme required for sulfatase activity